MLFLISLHFALTPGLRHCVPFYLSLPTIHLLLFCYLFGLNVKSFALLIHKISFFLSAYVFFPNMLSNLSHRFSYEEQPEGGEQFHNFENLDMEGCVWKNSSRKGGNHENHENHYDFLHIHIHSSLTIFTSLRTLELYLWIPMSIKQRSSALILTHTQSPSLHGAQR